MSTHELWAGAARRVITPSVGALLTGWNPRASGDTRSRYIHDELYVKALAFSAGGRQGTEAPPGPHDWMLLAADLTGVDAIATERIRQGITARTGLPAEGILVCATHTHSGPAVAVVVSLCEIAKHRFDGKTLPDIKSGGVTVWWADAIDSAWKEQFIARAIEAGVEAWGKRRPAEIAFGAAEVEGVGSSRRVRLSDGSWADPRKISDPTLRVVERTAIDPHVRTLWVRERDTRAPLAAVLNYGSHPWLFFGSGISAELAGATAAAVADAWRAPQAEPPVVLFSAGPEGDVTPIWNVDIENVWKTKPGESEADSLARRDRAFDAELKRLSRRLIDGVMRAQGAAERWDAHPPLARARAEVALPVKARYRPPPEAQLAEWQKTPPAGQHLTEVQVLRAGEGVIVALPGEPFTSLGAAIRARTPLPHVLVTALANEFGVVSYIADRDAHRWGGYEIELSPLAEGSGEALVEGAVALLARVAE